MVSHWRISLWYLVSVGESEPSQRTLFLLMPQLMGVLQPIMSRRSSCGGGGGGEGMVTGGISKDSSGGGGCLHWGRGPARRRV